MSDPDVKISKLGHNGDLQASKVAIDRVGHFFVTATRDQDNKLAITSWFLGPNGDPQVYDQVLAGEVGLVDIRHVGDGVFATAVGNAVGNLEVITWSLSELGKITRHEEIVFGKISALTTDAFQVNHRLVVAMTDARGKLRIKLLDIDRETQALEQIDNEVADDAQLVDVEVTAKGLVNLYTRNAEGNLQVSSFLHGRNDLRPSRGDPYKSGNLGGIKVAKRGGIKRHTDGSRVALIDAAGGLRVTAFRFARSRAERGAVEITREGSVKATVGETISIASHERDHGFWTATESQDRTLRIDFWGHSWPLGHSADGPPVSYGNASDSHTVKEVVCAAPWEGHTMVSATVTSDDRLIVSAWGASGIEENH